MPEDTPLISLAEDAYEATVDCISAIATEHIQDFGKVKLLIQAGSAAEALAFYLQRVHALRRIDDTHALEQTTDAERATNSLFPQAAAGAGPRAALFALVALAKTYRRLISYTNSLHITDSVITDIKRTLAELQLAYDAVCDWKSTFPIISSLKDRNHIVTISGIITILERSIQHAQTRVAKKSGTTLYQQR